MLEGFDPDFDDCRWTDAWTRVPIIQVLPGVYETFSVKSWRMTEADVCGRRITLSPPLEVRGLVTRDGTLWMSDVPQERLMMYNNAQASDGRVLVGGLGLGLYPQYALPRVESLLIIERDDAIRRLVEPIVQVAAGAHRASLDVRVGDVEEFLSGEGGPRYDTIFLDIWHTLDAASLPALNRLRDLAIRHLAPGGRVLLWGYRWMVRLFEQACEQLLSMPPAEREDWLEAATEGRPMARRLMRPVLARFSDLPGPEWESALRWCREYVVTIRDDEAGAGEGR
ncbi:MAG TPA: class I SAM-dependent methyltransferase [Chloroflexi bacterium]|nr:class I SAM-dependent methyltransferase [Chloroflexota bacterium]